MALVEPTVLDRVAALIGWADTVALAHAYGGRLIKLPAAPTAEHRLAKLLGLGALQALCSAFGCTDPVYIPAIDSVHSKVRRMARVARMTSNGITAAEQAAVLRVTVRRVCQLRREAVRYGLLPPTPMTG